MNSNAAAIRRRAGNVNTQNQTQTPQSKPGSQQPLQNSQPQVSGAVSNGLTLPQVIAVVDKRLLVLETFMKETKDAIPVRQPMDIPFQPQQQQQPFSGFDEYIQEMDAKFQLLAEEITNLKDIVLKLQTYTLEVNKTLFDERQNSSNNSDNSEYKGLSDLSDVNNLVISDPTTGLYA